MHAADLALSARDHLARLRREAIRRRYEMPGSPYRRISDADRQRFAPVLDVWRPASAPPGVILRWFMTEWCNYACPYCVQTHARTAPKGRGMTAHAFDNYPRAQWQTAIERHLAGARLAVLLTGGEPFVDRKAMVPFLAFLTGLAAVQSIRIDTNAWWQPDHYRGIDKAKITLMCTFHPSQTQTDRFLQRIDALQAAGFHVGLVNYVMDTDNLPAYRDHKEALRQRGIPLHPNPLWDGAGTYSAADLHLLRQELEDADFRYRTGAESPEGKQCLFPAVAYELDYLGNVFVGCHRAAAGSFFDERLPRLFAGPVPCPHASCVCLDKYSFLEGMDRNLSLDPLRTYGDLLRAGRRSADA